MLLHTVYHTKIYIVNIRKKESFEMRRTLKDNNL